MASAQHLVESEVAPSSPSGVPLASAPERRQRNIFDGLRQKARTVPLGRLSKCCQGMDKDKMTKSSSSSYMADRNRTMTLKGSKTCGRAVMDGTRLVLRDIITLIINITHILITNIWMSMYLHGPAHQLGPYDHARGVHTLTRPVGFSRGVGGTMVSSGLARDDRQGRSTLSARLGTDDGSSTPCIFTLPYRIT